MYEIDETTAPKFVVQFARRHNFIDAVLELRMQCAPNPEIEQRIDEARLALEGADPEWLADYDAQQDEPYRSPFTDEQIRDMLAHARAHHDRRLVEGG